MSDRFVFDPNNIDAFVDRWMAEVGNLYRGRKYNGWAMFNSERELIDVYVSDVEDKWTDITTNPANHDDGAWGLVLDRAKASGATNIINVHAHIESDPLGPCDGMMGFAQGAVNTFDIGTNEAIRFRGSVILHNDQLDGVLFSRRASDVDRAAIDPKVQMARALLPKIREQVDAGDSTARQVLPVVEKLARGERPSSDELIAAIRLLDEATRINSIVKPDKQIIDPLGLPIFDINDKRYMN